MSDNMDLVRNYVLDMDLDVVHEDENEEVIVVRDDDNGIHNLILDCEPPIVILEQFIMPVPPQPGDLFEQLLKMNSTLVHGAFVLDEDGKRIYFRDTLQLENLDHNELEASISALSLAMAEHADELLRYARSN